MTRRFIAVVACAAMSVVAYAGTAEGGRTETIEERGLPTGLISKKRGALPGYTLYSPLTQNATYLVNLDGEVVHEWEHDSQPGLYQYLLEDGSLVRAGRIRRHTRFNAANGWGGIVERISWDGDTIWRFEYADDDHLQHHDIALMPNGHVLIVAWEYRTAEEAIAAGRDPELLPEDQLWPDTVAEYDPDANAIVWEWALWDHLIQDFDDTKANFGDPAEHPEKVDVNFTPKAPLQTVGEPDWNHVNSVAYNADLDQIVISLRSFSEIWVVDHDTTTEEASGPAGDLLFRYGNPVSYRHGDRDDQTLFAQHDAEWIADGLPGEGRILVFNNGLADRRKYSSVDEIIPAVDDDGDYVIEDGRFAADLRRVYPKTGDDRIFAAIISGAQRLENGNTLIMYGTHGLIKEVTPKGRVVWSYEVPYFTVRPDTPIGNAQFTLLPWRTFRAERYPLDYPAFSGRDLDAPKD